MDFAYRVEGRARTVIGAARTGSSYWACGEDDPAVRAPVRQGHAPLAATSPPPPRLPGRQSRAARGDNSSLRQADGRWASPAAIVRFLLRFTSQADNLSPMQVRFAGSLPDTGMALAGNDVTPRLLARAPCKGRVTTS